MRVSKSTFPAWPVWLLLLLLSFMAKCFRSLDVFGLFTDKKSRLDEAIEADEKRRNEQDGSSQSNTSSLDPDASAQSASSKAGPSRWYHLVTPQIFYFMCNSLFLNRTKASLRLGYEPTFSPDEALKRSLDWYKSHLEL